jgi:hypothetical protein
MRRMSSSHVPRNMRRPLISRERNSMAARSSYFQPLQMRTKRQPTGSVAECATANRAGAKGELIRSFRRTFPASLSLHKGLSRESIQPAMRQDEPRHILGYLAGINDRKAEEVMVQGRRKNPEGQGMEPISLGFRHSFPWLSTTLLEVIGVQYLLWRTRIRNSVAESVLLPERLDGIEGGKCLPLKVETHALFRYAPRRRGPSFSFPEVIRKGMEDGPLRACRRLQSEDGSGRQKVGQYRMIPPPLKSFCRSLSTRADGCGT